jgi:hypothetical protein
MKFISIVTIDPAKHPHASPETIERMGKLIAEMRAQGALLDTGGREGSMDEFAESKEVVGGFALFEVENRDAALAWTNRFLDVLGGDATCYVHEVSPTP